MTSLKTRLEKPFGRDLGPDSQPSGQVCKEEQVYRIDHYLGKRRFKISSLRFANYLNRCGIASWLTTCRLLAETVGVEERWLL